MSSGETERSAAGLTALPSVDQLSRSGEGFEEQGVRDAFDAFRRHTAQLQAQLRVLQAARKTSNVEPTGHGIRMDALHLIRAAAEFADTLERDAQTASATQLQRTEEEVRRKQNELQEREAEVERYRSESERQRAEILNAAKAESRDVLAKANADATRELREAETRGNRLLEQSRHQATELTNSARAEVEQTLEWARAQATAVMARAQKGAEQLLAAAGLGEPAISQVVQSIVEANDSEIARSGSSLPPRPAQAFAAPPAVEPPVAPPAAAEPEPAPPTSGPPISAPPLSSDPPVTPSEPATQDDGHETEVEDGQPPAPPVTPFAAADTGQAEPAEDGESEPER
jgi:F0F1-type ATP synthase membrane subunit b/b'